MIKNHKTQQWFYPPDFMQPAMSFTSAHYVGYEASARLSELAAEYPDLFESRRRGKYVERRLRLEVAHREAEKIGGIFGNFILRQLEIHSIGKVGEQDVLL